MAQWYCAGLELVKRLDNRFPYGSLGSIPSLGVHP